jgi:cell division protein FtsB
MSRGPRPDGDRADAAGSPDDPRGARPGRFGRASRGRHAAPRRTGLLRVAGRMVLPVTLVGVTVGALLLGVFPTRTWLDQRSAVHAAEARLAELEAANAESQAQVDALQTDAAIEQIARQEYGLAKAGEEVYHVLPPPRDPAPVPDAWPFDGISATR